MGSELQGTCFKTETQEEVVQPFMTDPGKSHRAFLPPSVGKMLTKA